MIRHHERDGALECPICGELLELSRGVAGAPEVLVLVKEEFAREHKPCDQYADQPELARANRKYCAGMRAHLAQPKPSAIAPSHRRRRCR